MEQTDTKKLTAGLSFMGRTLGELLELKASCRRRLEYLEANRGRISEYVYNKLRQEYIVYLDAVDGEVALGLSEYEIKLAEIRLFANQLKLLEKSYREKLEELSLRHSLGEYGQDQYERLCSEHETKMQRFAGSLEKYQGQKKQIETFLAQARIEHALLDEDEPAPRAEAAQASVAAPEPEPAPEPEESSGPPRSSLLELDSQFTDSADEQETVAAEEEITFDEPEQEPAANLEDDTSSLVDLPGLSGYPESGITEEDEAPPEPEAMEIAQPQPLEESAAVAEPEPEPEALEMSAPEPVETPSEPEMVAEPEQLPEPEIQEQETAAPVSLEDELPEEPAETDELATVDTAEDLLPEVAPRQEVSEEPAAGLSMEESMVEEPAMEKKAPVTDLEALMGFSSAPEPVEQSPAARTEPEPQPGKQESTGFDLEHIFGAAQPAAEQEPAREEPQAEELNWGDFSPGPAKSEVREAELPEAVSDEESLLASPEPAKEKPAATLEDSLLDDLTGPAISSREPVPVPSGQPESDGGGIDLDDILDQSGAAGPRQRAIEPEPPAPVPEPVQDSQPESRSELERDLDLELEQAATRIKSEPVQELPEPEDAEEEFRPEVEDEPQPRDAGPSLVTLALQRASMEQAKDDEPADSGVEFNLGGEGEESDIEVRLTMNQTIDAIKKKTVKCPECGTMNYAIRWYCENCEATLTAL